MSGVCLVEWSGKTAVKDKRQAEQDMQQAAHDKVQAEKDKRQAEEDKALVKSLMAEVVKEGLARDEKSNPTGCKRNSGKNLSKPPAIPFIIIIGR